MDKLVETRWERRWWPEAWQRDQFIKVHAAALPPGSRVLDAGAGACKYRPFFAHCRYESQDFCQYQGELVKYTRPVDHVCDITRIPLPDQCLDAVLCTEVLEHVADPVAVLAEFARLLKPGGRLWLTTPLGCWLHMEPFHYYGGFTPYWFEHWLPRQGFRLDELHPQGGPGRVACVYLDQFYIHWRELEQRRAGLARWLGRAARLCLKPAVHYVLPWLARRLDTRFARYRVAAGYMVAATRLADGDKPSGNTRAGWDTRVRPE